MDRKWRFSLLIGICVKGLFAATVLFYGCKNNNRTVDYPNYYKWETGSVYTPSKLRGKPKEVKEFFYKMLTDTTLVPGLTGKHSSYEIYRFNSEGDLIFRQAYFDSTFINDFYYKYDENGRHYDFFSYGYGDTIRSRTVSVKIGDGKFKSKKISEGKTEYIDITTVLDNGLKVVIERLDKDSVIATKTNYYADGKLIKVVDHTNGEMKEAVVYYSAKGMLDSIVEKKMGKVSSRVIYVNNKYGDPVYYEESDLQGSSTKIWMKYEYDSRGNWIKQIARQEGGNIIRVGNTPTEDKHPEYSLLVREIKY